MRVLVAFALALSMAGCTDADWSNIASFDDPQVDYPDTQAPGTVGASTPTGPPNSKCQSVASERASDVGMQGFDDEIQSDVYNQVYAECVAWAARDAAGRSG
jgi:hypothetical protein